MPLSYESSPSCVFNACTTLIVTGRTRISYTVFKITCQSINDGNSSTGTTLESAKGKKIKESTLSPAMVLKIARKEKFFPLDAIFILLMIYAFTNDPAKKATKDAKAIRGANPNTA